MMHQIFNNAIFLPSYFSDENQINIKIFAPQIFKSLDSLIIIFPGFNSANHEKGYLVS